MSGSSLVTLIVRVGGNALVQSRRNEQLGLPDKGRVIKELVVKWVLFNLISRKFEQKRRDLAPLSYSGLLDLTLKCHRQQNRLYRSTAYRSKYRM